MAEILPQKQPVGGVYPIDAKNRPYLRFFWRRMGRSVRAKQVMHPGVHAVGWVRRAVGQFEVNMKADLVKFRKGNLPTREHLVDIFNENLAKAHYEIVAGSPTPKFPENENTYSSTHLKDSWTIVKAEG